MKVFGFILLGVLIYGGVFGTNFKQDSSEFRLLSARTTFTEKEQLGFLDGLHNGFAMPGAVAGNYCKWMIDLAGSLWGADSEPVPQRGIVPRLIVGAIGLLLVIVGCVLGAVMGFFIHLLFYFALLIKLLFVVATPAYHAGLLLGAGVTWLLFAAVSATNEKAATETNAA